MIITEEEFNEAFFNDVEVFGEEVTKYLYEYILSEILDEKILLEVKRLPGVAPELFGGQGPVVFQAGSGAAKEIANYEKMMKTMGPHSKEELAGVASAFNEKMKDPSFSKGFLYNLGAKVKGAFSKFAPSFASTMKKGINWISNPVNTPAVLGTTGGIILLTLIIKALKKKKMLNYYPNLRAASKKLKSLEESENPEFEAARAQILIECKTNPKLRKIMQDEKTTFNY